MPIAKSDVATQTERGLTRHELLTHEGPSSRLAVFFPGKGYGCDAPLLRYARKAALLAGCDTLSLEWYEFDSARPLVEQAACLAGEVASTIGQVLQPSHRSLLFVSKSFGTVVAGEVATRLPGRAVLHLFLTPLGHTIPYLQQGQGIMITGTADKWFSEECRRLVRGLPALDVVEFPGATHALELDDDLHGSLEILSQVCGLCTRLATQPA